MIEFKSGHEPSDDIEALIRSAGDYVRPSDDLRPRVLETARLENRERRIQRGLARMAAVVLLAITVISANRQPAGNSGDRVYLPAAAAMSIDADVQAAASSADSSWEMVESFTDLRRRQAQLLRL